MTTDTITAPPASLATLLAALLGDGHQVSFVRDPDGVIVHIDMYEGRVDGKPETHTGIADTPGEALQAAAFGAGLAPDPAQRPRFSDEILDERVTDLEEAVARLEERTGEQQSLLITTLGNAVEMLMDSGLWKPGEALGN